MTQLMGVVLGLLVIGSGIIVNVKKFGTDMSLFGIAVYVVLGMTLVLGMYILSRD